MRSIRETILWRTNVTFWVLFGIGFVVAARILQIQLVQGEKWKAKVAQIYQKYDTIPAPRGNIYAANGDLLATSVPYYQVVIDPQVAKDKLFRKSIDSLSLQLSRFFGDRTANEYKELIVDARNSGRVRFVSLNDRYVNYQEKQKIAKFPLFREGKMKGGGKFESYNIRYTPFDEMALRTIGKLNKKTRQGDFGLEYTFNNHLAGKSGVGLYERLAGGKWKPVEDAPETEIERGLDVYTTIDINFQDIAETALRKAVKRYDAKYGAAILMKRTGEIRAIANLSRIPDSTGYQYVESKNHAVISGTDPGSTFKLATMVALLEKNKLGLEDFVTVCDGSVNYNNRTMNCSHAHGSVTVRQVFEQSCNVGIFSLVKKYFFDDPDAFLAYLDKFGLKQKAIEPQLTNENEPLIKSRESKTWSRTTLPWMSIGYETRLSPLQMLAFYNAVANGGVWVKPRLVESIKDADEVIEEFPMQELSGAFCSERTLKMVREMMKGVVERGTANNIREGFVSIAGKTGTSQKLENGAYQGGKKYYTAFIGFFPADKPEYTCAVVIDEPNDPNLAARDVAAPVFREIADKVYAFDIGLHETKKYRTSDTRFASHLQAGYAEDFRVVNSTLGIRYQPTASGYVRAVATTDTVQWKKISNEKHKVPDLRGMTLRDALHILENKGFRVSYTGFGKVAEQSFAAGTTVFKNRSIHLTLK